MIIWIFVASFFLILVVLTVINFKLNKEFKIETSWLALSLAPLIIWLIITQQLTEFSGFGVAVKLREAGTEAVSLKIDGDSIQTEEDVDDLIKTREISRARKGGIAELGEIKNKSVEAITLELGRQGYYSNRAIEHYLNELTPQPSFKYVIFKNRAGEFKGIVWGAKLLVELQNRLDLVQLIESGDIVGINGVSTISIQSGSSKKDSLQLMEKHGLSILSVIDNNKMFVGTVDRGKITSSIVAQLVSSSNDSN